MTRKVRADLGTHVQRHRKTLETLGAHTGSQQRRTVAFETPLESVPVHDRDALIDAVRSLEPLARLADLGLQLKRAVFVKDVLKRIEVHLRRVPGVVKFHGQFVYALVIGLAESSFHSRQAAIRVKKALASTDEILKRSLQLTGSSPSKGVYLGRLHARQRKGLEHVVHKMGDRYRHRLRPESLEVTTEAVQQNLDIRAVNRLLLSKGLRSDAHRLSRKGCSEGLFLKVHFVRCHNAWKTPERYNVFVHDESMALSGEDSAHGVA
jgi:hypothetical protein